MGNTDEPPVVKADPKDWFKKPERPPTPDPEWNEGKIVDNKPTQKWLSGLAKAETSSKTLDDLMSTLIDFRNHQSSRSITSSTLTWHTRKEVSTGITYMTSLTKTKAAKYDLPGIEDIVPNLWSPIKVAYDKHALLLHNGDPKDKDSTDMLLRGFPNMMCTPPKEFLQSDISKRNPYNTYNNPQGIIYEDKYKRNRLMRMDELYKFSDGTLTSVRSVLYDIASNPRMDYLPKKRWSSLDRKRSHIIIKAIDQLLVERRLMRSLEKFVGGRDYEEDLRLLRRTI
ncbi:hypothetical protein Tco_0742953 [Tanacetum coccineum]